MDKLKKAMLRAERDERARVSEPPKAPKTPTPYPSRDAPSPHPVSAEPYGSPAKAWGEERAVVIRGWELEPQPEPPPRLRVVPEPEVPLSEGWGEKRIEPAGTPGFDLWAEEPDSEPPPEPSSFDPWGSDPDDAPSPIGESTSAEPSSLAPPWGERDAVTEVLGRGADLRFESEPEFPDSAPWDEAAEAESPVILETAEPEAPAEEGWDLVREAPLPDTASRGGLFALLGLDAAAEPLRVLRAQVLSRMGSLGGGSLLVTSAKPGEGKSFTALALAASIAEQGDRAAVLVEADLKAPSLLARFGLPASTGLSDYLLGTADLVETLVDPGYENLTLLPAGAPAPNGADLLGAPRMRAAFAELRRRRPDGFLVVDGPSLLSGADAVLLSLLVDAVLLVVEADETPEADLVQAVEALGGRPVVGLVYNKSKG